MKENSERPVPAPGDVVISTAGRDRKRFFIVTEVTEEAGRTMVSVTDGNLRKRSKGKRKNVRHVKVVSAVTDEEREKLLSGSDDGFVRELLGKYDPLYNTAEKRDKSPETWRQGE